MTDANTSYLQEYQIAEEINDIKQALIKSQAHELAEQWLKEDPLEFLAEGYFDSNLLTYSDKNKLSDALQPIGSRNYRYVDDISAMAILRRLVHKYAYWAALQVVRSDYDGGQS